MLGFVIPLRGKAASNDWQMVTRLVARTVRSVCNQTCDDFRIVLVCHDIPDLGFTHPRLDIFTVETPVYPDLRRRRDDRNHKTFVGIKKLLRYAPSHVMKLDADDCVSRRLAEYVGRHPNDNGWYIRRGYFHTEAMPSVHVERFRFHKWCGSSYILKIGDMGLPDQWDGTWYFKHTRMVKMQKKRGAPLAPLPFAGAVYNISHGENFNDYAPILWPKNVFKYVARRILFHRKLTSDIRKEFGLYPISQVG